MSGPRRIGIFGGSFDPIHIGHLLIAQDAAESMRLDQVLFVPAAHAPLRDGPPRVSAKDRLAMVKLAIDGDPRFAASDIDARKEGISYSIDTVAAVAVANPGAKLFWIIGADEAAKLPQWRRFDELAGAVEFICMRRHGEPESTAPEGSRAVLHWPKSRRFDISSTEIRERIASGRDAKYFLPSLVYDYIKGRNLYA